MSNFMNQKILEKKKEIEQKVKQNTDSIDKIINPSDLIHQNIDSWDNVDKNKLDMELFDSLQEWTYPHNHPYASDIENLAIDLYLKSCVRIAFEDLNPDKFKGPEDCIIEGYHLNSMSYQEARELVYEWNEDISFFHEYENEAMQFVENLVIEEQLDI